MNVKFDFYTKRLLGFQPLGKINPPTMNTGLVGNARLEFREHNLIGNLPVLFGTANNTQLNNDDLLKE